MSVPEGMPIGGPSQPRTFWTTSKDELDYALSHGWKSPMLPVANLYVFKETEEPPPATAWGIWRLYWPELNYRYYTMDPALHDVMVAGGWIDEGILGFVDTAPPLGA